EGLAGGDDDQEPPQVVPVVELREAAPGHAAEEAMEGVLDDVLLVRRPAAGGLELRPGQGHEPPVVALPERLGGGQVPALQRRDPARDRAPGRHGDPRIDVGMDRRRPAPILSVAPAGAIFFRPALRPFGPAADVPGRALSRRKRQQYRAYATAFVEGER